MNLKTILTRTLSGIIYIGMIVGTIFWGLIPFSFMASLLGIIAVIEFEKLCNLKHPEISSNQALIPLILDMAGIVCLCFGWTVFSLFIWTCIFIIRLVIELYLHNDRPISCLSHSLMSQLYIGFPLACMTAVASWIGLHFILVIFILIWINDTGAFIVGCSIGRNRLFERISPKKSWEGFFGGLAFNLIACWLFCIGGGSFWNVEWNVITWLILGALVTVFSTWGDLIESMIKRSLDVKDSGKIMPGHGGILDRIDSLLLVMPVCFLFIIIVGRGFTLF